MHIAILATEAACIIKLIFGKDATIRYRSPAMGNAVAFA
jgi:hypothetical protein